jgi:phosphate transport system substrate-binding protein
MKSLILAILLTCVAAVAAGDREARYLLTGSSTVAPIFQLISERIETSHPGFLIDVQTGGSTRGIVDTRAEENDAGMASRDLAAAEADGLIVEPVAYDGIALIVQEHNPLHSVTHEQVRAIFTGEIADWEAHGRSGDVVVVNKAEGRATLEVFLDHFGLENQEIQADVVIGDNAQGVRLVSANPNAIGYVSLGEALHAIESGVAIRMLILDGVSPSLESVASGEYPVRRTLYVLFRELDEKASMLLDFLRGPEGRQIVQELSFVPVGP